MTKLSVEHLLVPFSKKGALPSFSFELSAPSLLFVAGSNGIGKSTFLKQVSGTLPSQQSIRINDRLIAAYSLKERAVLLGFLEQQHSIHFPLTVKELVVMGRYARKNPLESYTSEDFDAVQQALDSLGISYLYEKNFLTLSGGEQQLCLLAQLSLQDPAIILMDEPTQSLDLHNKERVFDWMEKQVQEKGKLVICITHDLHWITKKKGHLLVLNTDSIQLQGLTEATVLHTIEELKRGS